MRPEQLIALSQHPSKTSFQQGSTKSRTAIDHVMSWNVWMPQYFIQTYPLSLEYIISSGVPYVAGGDS